MKHDIKVTLFLILLFLTSQIIGLYLLNLSIESVETDESGNIDVIYSEPITGRPDIEGGDSFTYIFSMILLGTVFLLLLIKFKMFKVWKAWFFLAIWGSLSIALSVIVSEYYALGIALILTYLKIYRPNMIIHNFTEVLMYGGIAILISPLFDVFWAVILLIAISIYDMIAVWKLKHMITLATAQAEEKMFAGLLIPYKKAQETNQKTEKTTTISLPKGSTIKLKIPKGMESSGTKSAILGGGDIAFPMLFAGSVMSWLIEQGFEKLVAYYYSLIVAIFAAIGLTILLFKSEKNKFYPAMPFISLGCFMGFGLILLI